MTRRLAKQKTSKPTIASLTRALRRAERERDAAIEAQEASIRALESPEFDQIMSMARRWHYDEVRSLVDSAIEELATERKREALTADDAREWLDRWLHQTIDGHEHVILTGQAVMLLAASDNDDAYEVEHGVPTADVSQRAFAALNADVWKLLCARSEEWERDDEDPEETE